MRAIDPTVTRCVYDCCIDQRVFALQFKEAGVEVPSAEAVGQIAQGITRGDIQAEDEGDQGVVMSALTNFLPTLFLAAITPAIAAEAVPPTP